MAVRKIIKIEEDKSNGCGQCVTNCAEGAIQIIDGKAKIVKDSYCDGLGACIGHCPKDALHIIERDADEFNEEEATLFVKNLKDKASKQNIMPEVKAAQSHGGGCPGSRAMLLRGEEKSPLKAVNSSSGDALVRIKSQLRQWPVQLTLVPVNAPYFENADLLITADCVPLAYPNYHLDLLKGKIVVIGCPKLDDLNSYIEKLTKIFQTNNIKSVTVAHMEVPCCSGIIRAAEIALQRADRDIPLKKVRIGINGEASFN